MTRKVCAVATLGLVGALTSARLNANAVFISGTGIWGVSTPVTPESAPGDTFSFTFDLPNPIASNPTFQATDFLYTLNGSLVPVGLDSVTFFPLSSGGLFDLNLSDSNVVSASGADVGSTLTIAIGTFPAAFAMFDAAPQGNGVVNITSTVPEPYSFGLVVVALASIAILRPVRRGMTR
jgi:hypothetical protein